MRSGGDAAVELVNGDLIPASSGSDWRGKVVMKQQWLMASRAVGLVGRVEVGSELAASRVCSVALSELRRACTSMCGLRMTLAFIEGARGNSEVTWRGQRADWRGLGTSDGVTGPGGRH